MKSYELKRRVEEFLLWSVPLISTVIILRIFWFYTWSEEDLNWCCKANHPALTIFQVFKWRPQRQSSPCYTKKKHLYCDHACYHTWQASATGCVNKPVKDFRNKFSEWYSANIVKGDEAYIVDMRLLVLQPINAQWIIHFFDYVKAHNAIITKDYAMLV